jgi:hypothetical protein
MTLTFGKFKGQELCSNPQWYQNWLSQQDWFKVPAQQVSYKLSAEKAYSQAHTNLLNSNYSERSVDAMFDAEKILDDAVAYESKYFGMNEETKQAQMDWDYAEIVACNQVDEYYND